jgi:hypothetical protein
MLLGTLRLLALPWASHDYLYVGPGHVSLDG